MRFVRYLVLFVLLASLLSACGGGLGGSVQGASANNSQASPPVQQTLTYGAQEWHAQLTAMANETPEAVIMGTPEPPAKGLAAP